MTAVDTFLGSGVKNSRCGMSKDLSGADELFLGESAGRTSVAL